MKSGCSESNARGRAIFGSFLHQFVPPQIASFLPLDFFARAPHHDRLLNGRAILQRRVRRFFQRDNFAPPVSAIGSDQNFRFRISDAVRESAMALNPPKITECTAPIRAQASIATGNSGIIGM